MPAFDQLVDDFLEHEFETMPVLASGLGLTHYDDALDDLSRGRAAPARYGRGGLASSASRRSPTTA